MERLERNDRRISIRVSDEWRIIGGGGGVNARIFNTRLTDRVAKRRQLRFLAKPLSPSSSHASKFQGRVHRRSPVTTSYTSASISRVLKKRVSSDVSKHPSISFLFQTFHLDYLDRPASRANLHPKRQREKANFSEISRGRRF